MKSISIQLIVHIIMKHRRIPAGQLQVVDILGKDQRSIEDFTVDLYVPVTDY